MSVNVAIVHRWAEGQMGFPFRSEMRVTWPNCPHGGTAAGMGRTKIVSAKLQASTSLSSYPASRPALVSHGFSPWDVRVPPSL